MEQGILSLAEPLPIPEIIAGVYLLLNGGEVVYVGQSQDIISRVAAHKREGVKDFDSVNIIRCDGNMNELECELINKFSPRYNGRSSWRGMPQYYPEHSRCKAMATK